MKKPKIFVIGLGGSIAAKEENGTYAHGEITQDQLLAMDTRVKKEFDLETTNLFRINSVNIQPDHWFSLANIIYYKITSGKYDGIVVTHGTATMHHTAAAMSFLIQNLNIPIVFTGATVVPSEIGSDAPTNFYDALRVAASDIAEVVIVFNGKIFRAVKAMHARVADFDVFETKDMETLGKIQFNVAFNKQRIKRSNRKPKLYTNLETNVALIKLYPSITAKIIDATIDTGIKGIVIEGYDVGTVPSKKESLIPSIKKANEKNIPVVMTSSSAFGHDWQKIFYKEIGHEFDSVNVIFGYDMRPSVALIKLMWVLAQTGNQKEIEKLIQTPITGEINPIKKRQKK